MEKAKTQKNREKRLAKQKGWKFWFVFWALAAVLLFGWYVFLQVKNKNFESLKNLAGFLPIGAERKNELQVLADMYEKAGGFGREQTFLVLFQNDMELRPGGGFIGAFGILKMKDGKVADIQVHDTGNFDGRIPDTETPPAPMAEMLGIKSWKLRDSNWSPDFRANAEKAEYFYKLGQGGENFDGIFAVNTSVLNSILSITGPVKIDDYPGEYSDENAILQLEYQVEKGFAEQGIARGERKSIMGELAKVLAQKAHSLNISQQLELANKIEGHLKKKDISMFFKDESLESEADAMNWSGRVKDYAGDYLMVVDANLNSLKSDYCMRRKISYSVDLTGDEPRANLALDYQHTCREKDWMTTNYQDWLRVYVPGGSWVESVSGQEGDAQFSEELGKKVMGMKVRVPVGESRTVNISYKLPRDKVGSGGMYTLLMQKQSGSGDVQVKVSVKKKDGSVVESEETLDMDKVFSF